MKTPYTLAAALAFSLAAFSAAAADGVAGPSTWAGEDALGRKAGFYFPRRPGKEVLMFYWTWHDTEDKTGTKVKNISKIIAENPDAMSDGDLPCWQQDSPGYYYWEEPLFGYYYTWDKWVLRKHAELLAAAEIDGVFFDCTNGSLTWDRSTDALLETWEQARKDGVNVPKIAFMLPFWPTDDSLVSLRHLYERLYKPEKYKKLWYCRKGKPCIMAYPDNLTDSPLDREIKNFFTFRPGQPDYVNGPTRNDQWGWLENYPQHGYGTPPGGGKPELVTAGVAQNACPETGGHCSAFNLPESQGRTFTKRAGFDTRHGRSSFLWGANFSEQWDRVFELDPTIVFVTGWNEWTAGMWHRKDGWTGEPFSFVDEFDWDHSRDIEPVKTWGEKGDVYYMQLVDRVRRFKGCRPLPRPTGEKKIELGRLRDWDGVTPVYPASKGNVFPRDCKGRGEFHYKDDSGRNDIVQAKVSRDKDFVYFAVWTAEDVAAETEHAWMVLFIDIDRDKKTGWQGYDLIVNRKPPKNGKAFVEKCVDNEWEWTEFAAVKYSVEKKLLVLRLPKPLFGKKLNFEFKWADNIKLEGDVMDFYVSGDVAPVGRFNYVYEVKGR